MDEVEDKEDEDIGAQIRWDTPYTQVGWDPYSLGDVCKELWDLGHDDNEEIDLDQDDNELDVRGDIYADEDEEDDDGGNQLFLLHFNLDSF